MRSSLLLSLSALVAAITIAAAAASSSPQAASEIAIERTAGFDRAYPLRGEPARVTVTGEDGRPLAGAVVEVVYRPNSQTSHTDLLPPTGADGTVVWTPTDAGIVALTAHQGSADGPVLASLHVAVRYGGFPASGIAVMSVAGLILFGGAAYGFAKLLGPDGGRLPPAEPPST